MTYKIIPLAPQANNIAGEVFGKIMAIAPVGRTPGHKVLWLCVCHCGAVFTRTTAHIKRALPQQSCGCLHYTGKSSAIHWKNFTTEHAIWAGMNQRCVNPNSTNFHNYGGRGIAVCDRWKHSFEAFFSDMGQRPTDKHSIDRIDNDAGYSPDNCRWATREEQAQNTRVRKDRIFLTHGGATKTIDDWADSLNTPKETIFWRLTNGWGHEQALFGKR